MNREKKTDHQHGRESIIVTQRDIIIQQYSSVVSALLYSNDTCAIEQSKRGERLALFE